MLRKMFMFLFCLVIGSMLVVPAMGQTGSDEQLTDMVVDSGGNVYVTGSSAGTDANLEDFATIKYDSAGKQLWVRRYNGSGNSWDAGMAIALDPSGNVYVTGKSNEMVTGSVDITTIKYDAAGNQQWITHYNNPQKFYDMVNDIAVDTSGNVYVTGYCNSGGRGHGDFSDYVTIKYNTAGEQQWVALYNGSSKLVDEARSIAVDSSGNVYVTGSVNAGGYYDYEDYGTIKYNSAGEQQWIALYAAPCHSNFATSLTLDQSGNVYVAGISYPLTGAMESVTVMYNSAGTEQWVARNASNYGSCLWKIAVDLSGNAYVCGTAGAGVYMDCNTVKYNSLGGPQWSKTYSGPGYDMDGLNSIVVDSSGNVYVTGFNLQGSGASTTCCTIKYDASGNQQWIALYNEPGYALIGSVVALDSAGNVYVSGRSYNMTGGTDWDYLTVKYDPSGNLLWVARYDNTDPAALIDALIVDVQSLEYLKNTTGFTTKLEGAKAAYADIKGNDFNSAINKMQAFINECNADKLLNATDRERLLGKAKGVVGALSSRIVN